MGYQNRTTQFAIDSRNRISHAPATFGLGDSRMSSDELTTIESSGTTSLLTDGTHYFLQPAGGSAVELSYGGAPVFAGEYGGWTWIGAEQTANGYEVAL
jgi:serralysin